MYVFNSGSCKDIVDDVEGGIRISTGQSNFVFTNKMEQLGMARVLLNKCGGEGDIAMLVIDAFFDPEIRRRLKIWVNVQHVGSIIARGGCFDMALAWARTQARCDRATPIEQESVFDMDPAYASM